MCYSDVHGQRSHTQAARAPCGASATRGLCPLRECKREVDAGGTTEWGVLINGGVVTGALSATFVARQLSWPLSVANRLG